MKKKLNIVFMLIGIALSGIIFFQIYWTVNAYHVNKEKFDTTINVAMQSAIDDCKKDYFDSIRRVLIKHLLPPQMIIRVDTVKNPTNPNYNRLGFLFLTNNVFPNEPYITSQSQLDYYSKKINHPATLPEIITEMSFYEPKLSQELMYALGPFFGHSFTPNDMRRHPEFFRSWTFKGKPMIPVNSEDKLENNLPPFYQHLRDSAIVAYFTAKKNNESPLPPVNKRNNAALGRFFSAGRPVNRKDSSNKPASKNTGYEAAQLASKATAKSSHFDSSAIKNMRMEQMQRLAAKKRNIDKGSNSNSQYEAGRKAAEIAIQNSVYATPPNYRMADSLKLSRYLNIELNKKNIYSKFNLIIKPATTTAAKLSASYSETNEVEYKYFGFKVFGMGPPSFFIRAKINNPQYSVLRNMFFTLLLSIILIVFVIFCFNYIVKTFIEQKKLADLKDDFINNMTHELKTPIATITVAIEGLQQFNALNDPEKTQRYLQTSRNELTRLNDLVTKVLDIATFENKEIDLFKQPVDISELIGEVVASEKSKVDKVVDISFHNSVNLSIINVDKIHFKNVLINLIDNAIKYSVEPVIINISCYKNATNAIISIKDNGIGIPAGHINLIFDKFHRVPTGNLHLVKGTGLGLSYVKYIVEAHGGSISVKSEVNKGSEFIVSIPLSNG